SGEIRFDGLEYNTDVKNGGYFGLGAGMEYDNFLVDLMYKLNTGKIEGENDFDWDDSLRNYRVTLSVGYKFNF
ncbi:MAG: outer membrane beta-barrel protein, partial [Fusobacteriaceae bacterium]